MMDSVQMAELIASLDSDPAKQAANNRGARDRRLVGRSTTTVSNEEVAEVVKESSRIFREHLREAHPK
jgi:hypothetical protein